MRPYSQDIRTRVIEAYQRGEGTQRQLACRFRVSPSFVHGVLRRYRLTGSAGPRPPAGGPPPILDEAALELIFCLAKERRGATLDELCDLFALHAGYRPSRATMWRALHKLNLGGGRKRGGRPVAPPPRSKLSAASPLEEFYVGAGV